MSVVTTLSDTVVQHLRDLSFGEATTINDKLTLLLEAEYRRRLARYSLTDQQLAIARDRYLTRLPIPLIAKKHKCTLYRVRSVLAELANLVEGTKIS